MKDGRLQVLLAYAYTGYSAANTDLEIIIKYVFRARNTFSLVIDRLPENIDARLGRAHINMNLTPQTGRPDKLLEDDARVYLSGFERLSQEDRADGYYRMGRSLMNLALAIVLADSGRSDEARRYIAAAVLEDIPPLDSYARDLYARYAKRLK
jgi:hypothetical protein